MKTLSISLIILGFLTFLISLEFKIMHWSGYLHVRVVSLILLAVGAAIILLNKNKRTTK